jgi:hypothetical protein
MPPSIDDVVLTNRLLSAVTGHRLLAFRMGAGVRLEFDDHAFHELTIEGDVRFRLADGSELCGDPVGLLVAGQLIRLLGSTVTAATVDQDGDLTVVFGDDRLVVPCGVMYESWQLRSGEGLSIVSLPGGDLAVWRPGRRNGP